MAKIAKAGILVGTSMMPIIPLVGDSRKHMTDLVLATKEHGGKFVIGGGLTMAGRQAERTLEAVRGFDPKLELRWRELYQRKEDQRRARGAEKHDTTTALLLREVCEHHGLADRIPRHIAPGKLATNQRIAERLFLKTYDLELAQAAKQRIWAYRRAAWTIDEFPESIVEVYETRKEAGLRELPGIGQKLAGLIATWLRDLAQ